MIVSENLLQVHNKYEVVLYYGLLFIGYYWLNLLEGGQVKKKKKRKKAFKWKPMCPLKNQVYFL